MTDDQYIRGLTRAGFRVPAVSGISKIAMGANTQVDLTNLPTLLVLAGERDNFVRVSGSGATTATIAGLSRRGFRIPRSSDGAYVDCVTGSTVTVDLTNGTVNRILKRSKRDWIAVSSATSATIIGTHLAQAGFTLQTLVAASATLTSDNTNPAVGDTCTINNVTYRFESTLAQVNDIKIGANADATLVSLGKAVNQNGVAGTDYFAGTVAPTGVSAGAENATNHTIVFTATTPGLAGNAFASTETSAHLSFGATTFTGGSQNGPASGVVRGTTLTIDPSQPYNFQQLRRNYLGWIEG